MNEDMYKEIFSGNLNRLMTENGKKQVDLISDLHLDKSTVSTWCNGTRLPRMDKVDMLAKYFGVKRSDLIEEKSGKIENPLILSPLEKQLIYAFRQADKATQDAALRVLEVPVQSEEAKIS